LKEKNLSLEKLFTGTLLSILNTPMQLVFHRHGKKKQGIVAGKEQLLFLYAAQQGFGIIPKGSTRYRDYIAGPHGISFQPVLVGSFAKGMHRDIALREACIHGVLHRSSCLPH